MRRRRIISRKPTKPRPRKTVTPERGTASNVVPRVSSSVTDSQKQLEHQARELEEAREQQAATSEVLRVIASSPADLKPVFETILANATRLCEARFGCLYRAEGETLRAVAMHRAPKAFVEERRRNPVIRPSPKTTLGRVILTKRPVQIADVREEPKYADAPSGFTGAKLAQLAGARTVVGVPLLKESELVGVIVIFRQEVRPFTDRQVDLVESFAHQALIAVENVRLLNELREALQQQTATADVLRVISSSAGQLAPVFQEMLENATRICEASFGSMALREGDGFRRVALYNPPPEFAEFNERESYIAPGGSSTLDRLMRTKQLVHLPVEDPDTPLAKYAGARTVLTVPLLKEDELVGVFGIYRREVRPFTDKQIELVQNFAAQAVIAIENARLLNELRERTNDLSEALEQQTAASEVLGVISSSRGELDPVFNTILANAIRICDAGFGVLYQYDGETFEMAAHVGAGTRLIALMQGGLFRPHSNSVLGRIVATKRIVEVADATKDAGYLNRVPVWVAGVEEDGTRSLLGMSCPADSRAPQGD